MIVDAVCVVHAVILSAGMTFRVPPPDYWLDNLDGPLNLAHVRLGLAGAPTARRCSPRSAPVLLGSRGQHMTAHRPSGPPARLRDTNSSKSNGVHVPLSPAISACRRAPKRVSRSSSSSTAGVRAPDSMAAMADCVVPILRASSAWVSPATSRTR